MVHGGLGDGLSRGLHVPAAHLVVPKRAHHQVGGGAEGDAANAIVRHAWDLQMNRIDYEG